VQDGDTSILAIDYGVFRLMLLLGPGVGFRMEHETEGTVPVPQGHPAARVAESPTNGTNRFRPIDHPWPHADGMQTLCFRQHLKRKVSKYYEHCILRRLTHASL
jgi:hypothetical protein